MMQDLRQALARGEPEPLPPLETLQAGLVKLCAHAYHAETRNNRACIITNFAFGAELTKRLNELTGGGPPMQHEREQLNDEVSQAYHLVGITKLTRNAVRLKVHKARRIFELFTALGYEKIPLCDAYSADELSGLDLHDIQWILG
jgi:hypothetical protein